MNTPPSLEQALIDYSQAIQSLKAAGTKRSLEQLIEVLCLRDQIESLLISDKTNASAQSFTQLVELDLQLKSLSQNIANNSDLENCRESLNPPQTSWWWFLTSPEPAPAKSPKLASFDWIWNALTVACLILSGTFMTNTLKAFSQNGLDLIQTFSAIAQGTGLVLVTGGTLTDKGKKFAQNALNSINIPSYYHAEVTFALSVTVLLVAYGINQSLPNLGQYYYQKGQESYNKGRLIEAQKSLTQALGFAPNDLDISAALGDISESLGNHDQAESMYEIGVMGGHPDALNGMGRVLLRKALSSPDLLKSQATFRLALNQPNVRLQLLRSEVMFRLALDQPDVRPALKAVTYSHLAFNLIKQTEASEKLPEKVTFLQQEAAEALEKAIEIDRTITQNRGPGLGMCYCYLAILSQQQSKMPEASQQWDLCVTHALPTSMDEYLDIMFYGKPEIVKQLDISKIVR